MIKHILLISSLIVSTVTSAIEYKDEWIISAQTDTEKFYLNPTRIEVLDNDSKVVELWQKTVVFKTYKDDRKGDNSLAKIQYDCIHKLINLKSLTLYKADGENVTHKYETTNWMDVVPDTIVDNLFKQVCKFSFPEK